MNRLVVPALVTYRTESQEFPWWARLRHHLSPGSAVLVRPLYRVDDPDEPLPVRRNEQRRRDSATEVVYYCSPRIVVTNVRIDSATGHYLVHELNAIDRVHEYTREGWAVAMICGAVEFAVGVALAFVHKSVLFVGLGLLLAVGLVTTVRLDERRNPRWMTLRAANRGCTATLFTSSDRQEFESVRRAVIRAVEANRVPRV